MTAIALSACDLAEPIPKPLHAVDPPPTLNRIRVLIVDGDPLARRAVAELLRAAGSFVVVATAGDGREGVELALHYRPDLVLAATGLPKLDVVDLVRRVVAETHGTRVVVLTVDREDAVAMAALRAGATGVVSKEQARDGALAEALRCVHAGEVSIPGGLARQLVERLRRMPEPGRGVRPIRSPLTTREWEVLDLLAAGLTTRAIADRLVLTEDTVYTHVKNLCRKLGVHSREQAVQAARDLIAAAVT
jgi:DNA-binding NarL/FixJ family response regulator